MMAHQSQLPEEIYMEILKRLSVKSLIRFKAVCKSWKSLISTPYFFDRHFDRSVANSNKLGIILTKAYKYRVPHCLISFHTLNFSPTSSGETCIEHTLIRCKEVKPLGWYRGLLLLGVDCSYNKLLLWNPSTNESKEIPDPPNRRLEYECISASALGYDFNVKSHKIVLIYKSKSGKCENHISVYTLKTNSWTSVDLDTDHKVASYNIFPITLANGAPHWVIIHGDVYDEDCHNIHYEIEYFDFDVNKFEVVPQPGDYDISVLKAPPKLYDTGGGHLCIGNETYEDDRIKLEIWVMKKDCWSKLWMCFEDKKVPLPICFAKNINVSLKLGDGGCAIYNGKEKGSRLECTRYASGLRKRAFTFYQSLVCLEPEEVQER
ncbi:hypothetical protein CCACVL1_28474 [Corchorus capsularis]|uniref:F-box domain-containing protein n=1 Tax=Corchorus capsularis TaxID=210143 RepID=A0A1R3G6E5_COCAP|nr:hypothetical protein CCACVL1_28474 [Corchorus capsularis]